MENNTLHGVATVSRLCPFHLAMSQH